MWRAASDTSISREAGSKSEPSRSSSRMPSIPYSDDCAAMGRTLTSFRCAPPAGRFEGRPISRSGISEIGFEGGNSRLAIADYAIVTRRPGAVKPQKTPKGYATTQSEFHRLWDLPTSEAGRVAGAALLKGAVQVWARQLCVLNPARSGRKQRYCTASVVGPYLFVQGKLRFQAGLTT